MTMVDKHLIKRKHHEDLCSALIKASLRNQSITEDIYTYTLLSV